MTVSQPGMPTGFSVLDQALAQRGWPIAGLADVRLPAIGIGELRLLAPALRRLAQAGRTVALLVPPSFSYAPQLIQQGIDLKHVRAIRHERPLEGLDGLEPLLRSACFGAIVAWLPAGATASRDELRRLQLAARLCHCPAILFRGPEAGPADIDPAPLSIAQVQLQVEAPRNDTIRVRPLGVQYNATRGNAPEPFTLSLPPVAVRRRQPAGAGQDGGISGGSARVSAGSPASEAAATGTSFGAALGNSVSSLIAAISPRRPDAPRGSWPFRQRRRTPDTPALPLPVRGGMARPC
ncbi:hypothetical protein GCM10023144_29110 [Pigmentiphaga soli]|uniref:Translesion DNA synthesis-associated protein ImuA n=1 Tax=Pigmentiphaga soli TaxID=1007095 RepID=A0ABP8H7W4_9BURK